MSPVRAFIFPQSQCGAQFEEIKSFAATKVKEYADYDPAQAESAAREDEQRDQEE